MYSAIAAIYLSPTSNLVPIILTTMLSEISKLLNSLFSKCRSLAANITSGLLVSDSDALTPALVILSIVHSTSRSDVG